jgi:hypothetical protein
MGTLPTIWAKQSWGTSPYLNQLSEYTSLKILKTLIVKRLCRKKNVGTKELVRERSKNTKLNKSFISILTITQWLSSLISSPCNVRERTG